MNLLKNYYTIPFDSQLLVEKKRHPLCEVKESVQMNINLIVGTHFGECKYNSSYGCYIWNKDYSTVTDVSDWKDELKKLLTSSIIENEPRLDNINVKLGLEEANSLQKIDPGSPKIKHKIIIEITGVIRELNEPFEHVEFLYFSPLSID
jgi:predicted component of type VI protein secretion system